MRSLIVEAKSLTSASELCEALAEFKPDLTGNEADGYFVLIPLRGPDRHVLAVLDAIQNYIESRSDGPARVELDGQRYTMHSS
jgi:hypothetical protein